MKVFCQKLLRLLRNVIVSKQFQAWGALFGCSALCRSNPHNFVGVVNFPGRHRFYKVEFEPEALTGELEARRQLGDELQSLFCPLSMHSMFGLRVAVLERMRTIDDPAQGIPYARTLLAALAEFSKERVSDIKEFSQIVSGLALLERYGAGHKAEEYAQRIREILASPRQIGPVHGDFHQGNIVVSAENRPFLIDADCFRNNGLQSFDKIYYAFEAAIRETLPYKFWLEELFHALQGKGRFVYWLGELGGLCDVSEKDGLLVYFVDRLGQDHRFIGELTQVEKSHLLSLIELL